MLLLCTAPREILEILRCRAWNLCTAPPCLPRFMKKNLLYIFLLFLLCALPSLSREKKRKAPNDERITLVHADNLFFVENEIGNAKRLSGHVVMKHAGMTMY